MTNTLDLDWHNSVAFDCIHWVGHTLDGVHTFGSNSLRTYAVRSPILLPVVWLTMAAPILSIAVVLVPMVLVVAVVSLTF